MAVWSKELKQRILEEGNEGKTSISELCRKYGVGLSTYYKWVEKEKSEDNADEVSQLKNMLKKMENENKMLKEALIDKELELRVNQELLKKTKLREKTK